MSHHDHSKSFGQLVQRKLSDEKSQTFSDLMQGQENLYHKMGKHENG